MRRHREDGRREKGIEGGRKQEKGEVGIARLVGIKKEQTRKRGGKKIDQSNRRKNYHFC